MRGDLEKERKSLKELQTQNVRLKSLVKIGEDSIKAEQTRISGLEEQLRLRNGSVSASTPCLTSNGSSPLKNSSNSLNVHDEVNIYYSGMSSTFFLTFWDPDLPLLYFEESFCPN